MYLKPNVFSFYFSKNLKKKRKVTEKELKFLTHSKSMLPLSTAD